MFLGQAIYVLGTLHLEFSQHMGVATHIGLTSHLDSALKDMCQVILNMGNIREEGCPIGLTPTSTIAVMLAISDAIAMAVMEAKGITKRDFGLRHHGGYLGRVARTDNVDD
jgi:arabinose-5-phosphate isomerase